MGTAIEYSCIKCNKSYQLKTGHGMFGIFEIDDLILYTSNKKEKALLTRLQTRYNGKLKDVPGYNIYECSKCNTLHSRLEYQISYNRNDTYIKNQVCSKCNSILIKLPEDKSIDFTQYNCKKCNDKTIDELFSFTMWD
ncbi:hypothetical protein CI105_07340 [Candidatus Izimaplasma bacterium ZiA1]|uniref:hypothetical protein n=1 Tax=Candidatus Izimoplasma sp. ZiA1 TaxID=2024899 RepID=UPI000BAA63B0|nr:hypothetical protein CI105_07340 [Candidatus Izimaplasma bacterium ZiA1]